MSISNILRKNLKPAGSKNLVRLSMRPVALFNYDFILQCLDEMELKSKMISMGLEQMSSLERLGVQLLMDSTGLTLEEIKELNKSLNSKIVTKAEMMVKL